MTTPVATRLSAAELERLREQMERRGQTTLAGAMRDLIRDAMEQEQPYRLDRKGNFIGGKYDFSTDVIAAAKNPKGDAQARVMNFLRAQFVSVSDASPLNPNRQGDLFVSQRDFRYPLWSAVAKGTIDDITPFVLPKYSSSSGLVAGHTEGVEPASGTFVTAGQTVTATPLSGKVSITREAWDQGGNPKLSQVLWEQIQRGWFEALEAAVAALLEAAAPTTITVTTAAVDAALADSLESQLIPLAFVRGGSAMRELVLQVDLFTKLAMAKDTTGRRLFRRVSAADPAAGDNDVSGVIVADGLIGKPGWALAASGTVSANSYLFDRTAVSGWATPPQRLLFDAAETRYVHIGIWGYKAFAINDLTGVRRIAYDPV